MGLFKKKENKGEPVEAHAPIEQGEEQQEAEKNPVELILRNQDILAQNQQAIMKELGEVKQGLVELYNRIEELADEEEDEDEDDEPEPPKPPKKVAKKTKKRR